DVKELGIKSPSLNPLQGENRLGGATGKCFESALGIFLVESEKQVQKDVEDASIELAKPALPFNHQAGIEPAGADGDVTASGNRCEELGGFFDGRRQVGIGLQEQVTVRDR